MCSLTHPLSLMDVVLLRIKIDKLTFTKHVSVLCTKASKQLNAFYLYLKISPLRFEEIGKSIPSLTIIFSTHPSNVFFLWTC